MPTSCSLARAGWGDKQGAQLRIRSYEMGVVVHPALLPPVASKPPLAPHAGKFVASFLTPDHPLHLPGRLDTAALEMLRTRFGLHAVALGAPSTVPDAPRRVVFLPYDPIHPQPYRAGGELVRDIPWTKDGSHCGLDLLGRKFQEIVEAGSSRTYYGPSSWMAPVLEL
jgi:hypothetical protein